MLSEDFSTTNHEELPLWSNHVHFEFKTASELMNWVSTDKVNFVLSDKVYAAMVDCLEHNIDEVIVATISIESESTIDVVIRKPNFPKILSSYVKRLLENENYEKLADIKKTVEKYGLEI